jgi:hypothetical protein
MDMLVRVTPRSVQERERMDKYIADYLKRHRRRRRWLESPKALRIGRKDLLKKQWRIAKYAN